MFRPSLITPSLVCLLLLATAASAQLREPPREVPLAELHLLGIGIDPLLYPKRRLLDLPAVQKELEFTSEQMERWKKGQEKLTSEMKLKAEALNQKMQDARARQDDVAKAALREEMTRNAHNNVNALDSLLVHYTGPRQFKRLDQIQIQAEGQYAFTRLEIQKRLNLSPGQIALIEPIVSQSREKGEQASVAPSSVVPGGGGSTPEERDANRRAQLESKAVQTEVAKAREAVLKVRQETLQSIVKHLTKGQRELYLKMRGEPFDFAQTWTVAPPASAATKSESKK